jgi:hypothetical protein
VAGLDDDLLNIKSHHIGRFAYGLEASGNFCLVEDYPVEKLIPEMLLTQDSSLKLAFLLPYAHPLLALLFAENYAWDFPPISSTSPDFFSDDHAPNPQWRPDQSYIVHKETDYSLTQPEQ